MFDASNCASCGSIACLMKCQWIDFESIDEARTEINKIINEEEDSLVLKEDMV